MAEKPIPQASPLVEAALAAMIAKGGGSGGTGAVSAPATQEWVVMTNPLYDDKQGDNEANPRLVQIKNPNYTPPKAAQPQVFGSNDLGYYTVDAQGNPKLMVPAHTPNADEEIKKALDREQSEQLRLQRQRNEQNGFGYADDDTVAKRSLEARKANLDDKEYARSKANDDEKVRQFDIQQAAKDKVDAANIGLTTAQTGLATANTARTGVETSQIQQNIDIAKAKLPGDLAQAAATLAGTKASTAATTQATQIAGAPQVQAPQTGMYTWQKDPKTGEVKPTGINVEYQAKTQADVLARIGQMHSLMQQKSDEVQAKVDAKTITPDQGLAEFNQWYDRNITPQAGALQAAQQAAQFKQAQDEATMRASAYQNALSAGTQARENWTANNANRVGPNWAAADAAASRGDFKALGQVQNAYTYSAPDVNQVANNAVNEALKYLSPSAAQATGTPMPNFQNVDISQQLSSAPYVSRFGPGAPVGMGAPPPPPPMGPVAPPNQVPGQNYGAGTAYTGGVAPWNFTPDMLGTFQYGGV